MKLVAPDAGTEAKIIANQMSKGSALKMSWGRAHSGPRWSRAGTHQGPSRVARSMTSVALHRSVWRQDPRLRPAQRTQVYLTFKFSTGARRPIFANRDV